MCVCLYLSGLLAGRLKLGLLARLLHLLVLGQAVGVRCAQAASSILLLAQDFTGETQDGGEQERGIEGGVERGKGRRRRRRRERERDGEMSTLSLSSRR